MRKLITQNKASREGETIMSHHTPSALVGLLVVTAISMVSPVEASKSMDLEQAISTAFDNNVAIQAAQTEVEATEHGIRVARAQSYPTLAASGSFGTYSGDVLFTRFIPGAPGGSQGMDVGSYDSNQMTILELVQPIYAGGALTAQRQMNSTQNKLAAEELRQNRLMVAYEVTAAFYAVLLAEQQVEVATESLRRSQQGFEHVDSRFQLQEALKAELLGAKSQVAADQLGLKHAENQQELAKRQLNILLGRELDASVDLSGSLADAPGSSPLSGDIRTITQTNPAVQKSLLQHQLAGTAVDLARAMRKPKVELRGSYAWIDNDLLFKGDYAAITLNLSIPFAQDLVAGRASTRQAEARQRLTERSTAHAKREVQLKIEHALRRLEEATAAVEVAKTNVEFHHEKHRICESAYTEGLVTYSDLLDDHVELAEAELDYNTVLYEVRLAEANLKRVSALGS
jgi:outer membrane protein TolC